MFDTRTTVVGNAVTKPELKVIASSGVLVANFRVISNSRHRGPDWAMGRRHRVSGSG